MSNCEGKLTTDPMSAWFCGECMNSSEFSSRVIVPRDGQCECCGRADNGKVWELGGITRYPRRAPHSPAPEDEG